ncbi:hypothetical protein LEP1GSC192_3266 [Leptospira sp. B5-022]|nr:hypothetical protein LEP1GSC192_3266 [Leptospira sp. B5-022]
MWIPKNSCGLAGQNPTPSNIEVHTFLFPKVFRSYDISVVEDPTSALR